MRVTDGHALGEEAAGVVRQAASLAARRGHAQVTPLHIASVMLSAEAPALAGILRAACVRSQSYPMQHNALDLCLDHALARLAVTRPVHGGDPAPSNAFVAVLNRAQAHRRSRGEGKVELDKLLVSVLDDPSVGRVMRAAGFSSSQVSATVESSAALPEQSGRTGCDVLPSSPNPAPRMIRAGGGQPSLRTVLDGSECQPSKTKPGAEGPTIFGCSEVKKTTTTSIPPWLRRYNDKTCTSSPFCRSGTGLQADVARRRPKFTELTATNLKILCDALELRVPWHYNIIPGISSTVLRCRSGVTRRRVGSSSSTWLLFLGRDGGGKMAVARELARIVFGSYAEFITLQVQQGNPERTGKLALKRPRSPENDGGGLEARLFGAIMENPHRVIFIDGVDRLDRDSEMRIKNAIAGGSMVRGCNGDVVGLEDAIVVLSASHVMDSRYVASSSSSPRSWVINRRFSGQNRDEGDAAEMEVMRSCRRHSWDLNVCCAMDGEQDILADEVRILNVVDGVFLLN